MCSGVTAGRFCSRRGYAGSFLLESGVGLGLRCGKLETSAEGFCSRWRSRQTCMPHFPDADQLAAKVSALKPPAQRRFVQKAAEKWSKKVEKWPFFCLDRLCRPLYTALGGCIDIYITLLSTRVTFCSSRGSSRDLFCSEHPSNPFVPVWSVLLEAGYAAGRFLLDRARFLLRTPPKNSWGTP